MQGVIIGSLVALWCVAVLILLLTLRLVRCLRSLQELQERSAAGEYLSELMLNTVAPQFRLKTLSGDWVELTEFTGCPLLLLFVSPHCGPCRRELPHFTKLSTAAKERANVEFVLVSDSLSAETNSWLNDIRLEDNVEVNLPVLVAPRTLSEFGSVYNPRGISPYFCYIDEQGIVRARGPVGIDQWTELIRPWINRTTRSSPLQSLSLSR